MNSRVCAVFSPRDFSLRGGLLNTWPFCLKQTNLSSSPEALIPLLFLSKTFPNPHSSPGYYVPLVNWIHLLLPAYTYLERKEECPPLPALVSSCSSHPILGSTGKLQLPASFSSNLLGLCQPPTSTPACFTPDHFPPHASNPQAEAELPAAQKGLQGPEEEGELQGGGPRREKPRQRV